MLVDIETNRLKLQTKFDFLRYKTNTFWKKNASFLAKWKSWYRIKSIWRRWALLDTTPCSTNRSILTIYCHLLNFVSVRFHSGHFSFLKQIISENTSNQFISLRHLLLLQPHSFRLFGTLKVSFISLITGKNTLKNVSMVDVQFVQSVANTFLNWYFIEFLKIRKRVRKPGIETNL